jgi:putative membrane protein
MLDFVFLAMFIVVPVLLTSIYLVRVKRQYQWHKRLQLMLAIVLLITIGLFEWDMRFMTDWRARAAQSAYFDVQGRNWVDVALFVHLCCAVPTFLVWLVVVVGALRGFGRSPKPGPHSRWHRLMGWVATAGMVATALTGWLFYWMAFVA